MATSSSSKQHLVLNDFSGSSALALSKVCVSKFHEINFKNATKHGPITAQITRAQSS